MTLPTSAALKILLWRISITYESLYLQITPDVNKVMKNVQCHLTFIFIELSETSASFVKIRLVFVIKNVASFMQTLFYWKRDSTRMYKHLEAFHTNMAYKLALVVLLLQLLKKKIPKTPTFYIKMEHFEIVFHLMWYKRQVSRPWGPVFPTGQFLGVCFYSGPGSEPKPGF